MRNNKGSARDVLFIVITLFALGIGFFSLNFAFNTSFGQMMNVSVINESQPTKDALTGTLNGVVNRMDYLIFGTFIALCLALLITSWFIGGNPIFMVIYFFVIVLGVVISTIFANTWETYIAKTIFGNTASYFPITNNLMINLPIYVAIVGFLGIIAMFMKPALFPEG